MSIFKKSTANAASVVVIGGGATGVGIARDAALRGFKVTLVERGELGSGTTGHFHGILHSGGRYAVNDPHVAAECYSENQILRHVIPTAIRDTGGMFVALSDEEAAHTDVLMAACKQAGIPTKEISPEQAIAAEPHLTHAVQRAFTVPDGFINGAEVIRLNLQAAVQAEIPATFLTQHTVTGFRKSGKSITAVTVTHSTDGTTQDIPCDYVVNAAGVWAGRVAELADAPFEMVYDKGTMIVFKHSFSHAVLNRCRPENDADLLVPGPEGSIMGTTARVIAAPDECFPTQEEVDVLLRDGTEFIPQLRHAEATRVYAGVRPLFRPGSDSDHSVAAHTDDTRSIPRSFRVLDHQTNGVSNFISIIGGKVTLYRLMAERAVDLLCKKSGTNKPCSTATTSLEVLNARSVIKVSAPSSGELHARRARHAQQPYRGSR